IREDYFLLWGLAVLSFLLVALIRPDILQNVKWVKVWNVAAIVLVMLTTIAATIYSLDRVEKSCGCYDNIWVDVSVPSHLEGIEVIDTISELERSIVNIFADDIRFITYEKVPSGLRLNLVLSEGRQRNHSNEDYFVLLSKNLAEVEYPFYMKYGDDKEADLSTLVTADTVAKAVQESSDLLQYLKSVSGDDEIRLFMLPQETNAESFSIKVSWDKIRNQGDVEYSEMVTVLQTLFGGKEYGEIDINGTLFNVYIIASQDNTNTEELKRLKFTEKVKLGDISTIDSSS